MATLRKITLHWEIRTGAISCDTGYIKRQEKCDVDLYVTVDGTAYALDTGWGLNLSVKPMLLGDNAALVAVTSWAASSTTGLYQATAQTIGSTALDTYLAANNSDTTDDEGNKLVDLDVYYTVSAVMESKSDTVTLICKPDVGRTEDGAPTAITTRNDFLVSSASGLLVNVAAGYKANGGTLVAAQASVAITNATNYIELTAAGGASVNTSGFTAGNYPLAIVVASAGVITSNTDVRPWITPKPASASIATGKTLWVDSVNGSDVNAGTLSAPMLTIAAAKAAASSGDLVHVWPGTYTVTASILKDGVNWHFSEGSTVNCTSATAGILDDGSAAMTCIITGEGVFNFTYTGNDYAGCVHTAHASSNVNIHCRKITSATSGSAASGVMGVYGGAGTLTVVASETITATDTLQESGVAVYWSNGNTFVSTPHIAGRNCGVWSHCDTTPTGDFYVDSNLIEVTGTSTLNGYGVVMDYSANSTAAAWVRAGVVKSPAAGIPAVLSGIGSLGGRMYVTAQKLFGRVMNDSDTSNSLLYVEADKIEGVGNGTATAPALVYMKSGTNRITCRHWNPSTFTGEQVKCTGGTLYLRGGDFTGGASAKGIEVTGGTVIAEGVRFDTSAASGVDTAAVSGGTLLLNQSVLSANAAKKDINNSGGTVTVTGGSGSGTLGAFTTTGTVGYTKAPTALLADTVTTNANLTGDVTSVGNATTLATVASAGTTGSSTAIPVVTINVKGLATSVSTAAVIAPAGTLTGATLASGVTASSLTSVGTLTGGATGAGFTVALTTSTITGTLAAARGGTGVSNTGTITLAGNLVTTGAFNTTFAQAATTTVTLPSTSSTMARTDAGQTFTGVNVFTSPKVITGISDTNGNTLLAITATASAVDYLTLANAATGGGPILSATGSDSAIPIILTPLGTAPVANVKASGATWYKTVIGTYATPTYSSDYGIVASSDQFVTGSLASDVVFKTSGGGRFLVCFASTGVGGGTQRSGACFYPSGGTVFGGFGTDPGQNNVSITGTLTVTGIATLTGGILGTVAGGNATAGNVGEYVSASVVQGSATALTTATPKTVTSITLTAGDWDITAIGSITGASTGTAFDVAIGTTTNSFTGTVLGDTRCETPTVSLTGADATLMIPAVRVTISGSTTYYLVVQEVFTIGTPAAYGRISARRVR